MYIYNADVYCDDCGRDIIRNLKRSGIGKPDSDDSDDWPQRVQPGESDTPDHCGSHGDCINAIELSDGSKVGMLLHTRLTTDGVDYVREAIREGGLLAREVWAVEFSDYDLRPFAGEFMQPDVEFGTWRIVETKQGTSIIPDDCDIQDVVGNDEVLSVKQETGYFARLSAPGYLDCTDWCGPFDTEDEAMEYLVEMYAD